MDISNPSISFVSANLLLVFCFVPSSNMDTNSSVSDGLAFGVVSFFLKIKNATTTRITITTVMISKSFGVIPFFFLFV